MIGYCRRGLLMGSEIPEGQSERSSWYFLNVNAVHNRRNVKQHATCGHYSRIPVSKN